ncbi:MAG: hypothetical protein HEEMFOPI_01680 [Holosporales bacterium]
MEDAAIFEKTKKYIKILFIIIISLIKTITLMYMLMLRISTKKVDDFRT